MRTDESYIYEFDCKFNYYNQSIIIAFYIEYIMLISYTVNSIESLFDIGKAFPIALLHNG